MAEIVEGGALLRTEGVVMNTTDWEVCLEHCMLRTNPNGIFKKGKRHFLSSLVQRKIAKEALCSFCENGNTNGSKSPPS